MKPDPGGIKNCISKSGVLQILALSVASASAKRVNDETGKSDPSNIDSDRDRLTDAEDAVPNDIEINWPKTAESRYVWIEQMVTPVTYQGQPNTPVAVNSSGLILFKEFTEGSISYQAQVPVDTRKNVLWDSAVMKWVTLSNRSSQTINIDGKLAVSGAESIGQFKDINDAGTISGIGDITVPMPVADTDHKTDGILSGMVWKKSTNSPTTNSSTNSPLIYDVPTYYIHHISHSVATRCTGQIGSFAHPEVFCNIGIDDSINVSPYIQVDGAPNLDESVWMIYDGITNPALLDIRVGPLPSHPGGSELSRPGGILDKNRALCVIGSGLYLKDQNSVQLVTTGTISAGQTDIVLAPVKRPDDSQRLWIAAGSKVLLEKRAGGTGADRWHNPPSMGEGAIRLNAQGVGITCGRPDPTAPIHPKLWRNGIYTDLNEVTSMPSTVTITEAIDLASNGIILVQATENGVAKTGLLLQVDLDIVHPARGELAESDQHDSSKGGYIAVRRDYETPVTKLVIRPCGGVSGMKYKVKFAGADKFKLWKDPARTQAVVSESTEFDPAVETVVYFEGLKKSGSVGAEAIILQAVIGGTVTTGETVYCTVVEAEFDIWLNVFIPIQWTDFPAVHPIHIDLYVPPPPATPVPEYRRKIAAGDDRTFINEFLNNPFSDVDDIAAGTACRAHSQLTIIPFSELDQDGIKDGTIKDAIGESFNYLKRHSVPDWNSGYSTTNRLLPVVTVTQSGRAGTAGIRDPSLTVERYGPQNNGVRFKLEGSADNPIVNPSPAIDWDFSLAITVNNSNVLAPKWLLLGNKQDAFPAYEIYVRDSDGNSGDDLGTEIYKYDPIPLGRTPADLFPEPAGADETVTTATGDVP